jgi:hypothetical protein
MNEIRVGNHSNHNHYHHSQAILTAALTYCDDFDRKVKTNKNQFCV